MHRTKWTIQVESTRDINEEDLTSIAAIEQDAWAHGLWEYLKCNDCSHIHSKQDIYQDLPKDMYKNTVKDIRSQLWSQTIPCQKCNGKTSEIYWEEYIECIRERYNQSVTFLTTFRGNNWEIHWFVDWYVSDFSTIYRQEFQWYYDGIGLDRIIRRIEKLLWKELPDNILACSAWCLKQTHQSLYTTYNLMKVFYRSIYESQWHILGIYESVIWTNTHAIYHITWAQRSWIINLLNNKQQDKTHSKYESDILIHPDAAYSSTKGLEPDLKNFLRKHSCTIREIIEMGKN